MCCCLKCSNADGVSFPLSSPHSDKVFDVFCRLILQGCYFPFFISSVSVGFHLTVLCIEIVKKNFSVCYKHYQLAQTDLVQVQVLAKNVLLHTALSVLIVPSHSMKLLLLQDAHIVLLVTPTQISTSFFRGQYSIET